MFELLGLKSYFIQSTSSSSSGPSTRGSANAICHEPIVEVEEDAHVPQDNGEEDAHVQQGNDEEDAIVQEESGEAFNGQDQEIEGIITEFYPDHIISDPGLCMPIDCFAPSIRDEVRRAFISKGPTQPTGHRFPQSNDKRSFKKHWFQKVARIADIYYDDFSFDDRKTIKDQLQTFIIHVRRLEEFKACYDLAIL
jgi:hypothetical protein